MCIKTWTWVVLKSEDSMWKPFLCFHHVDYVDVTQVRLGGNHLHPLNHLGDLRTVFILFFY